MKVKKEHMTELAKKVLGLLEPAQNFSIGSDEPRESFASASATDTGEAGSRKAFIITLQGELGAGKTTFTQALARELGSTETIQSPTYVLMKSYPISFNTFKKLVHIDAYRLEKPEEFIALEPKTFLNDPENLVVIEWPERVESVLPAPDISITFAHGEEEDEREVEITQKP